MGLFRRYDDQQPTIFAPALVRLWEPMIMTILRFDSFGLGSIYTYSADGK